jgi:hypothetical protein
VTPRWVVYDEPGGGGGGPWEPSQLSSLAGWYAADDITGVSNNSTFPTWADASSASNDMTTLEGSHSGSTNPVYRTSVLNGKPVVGFPQTTDRLAAAIDLNSQWMVATVFRFKTTSGTSNRTVWTSESSGGARNAPNAAHFWQSSTYRSFSKGSVVTYQTLFSASGGVWYIVVEIRDGSGGTGTRKVNSDGVTVVNVSDADEAPQDGVLAFGRGIFDAANIELAEVVVTTSTPNATDIEKVEGYYAHKWGLAGNLPVSHPYKNAAP